LHNKGMSRQATVLFLPPVLVTGFDAFGGNSLNPSWLTAHALNGSVIHGHPVVSAQLPTTFEGSGPLMLKLLRQHKPALVVCVGLSGGRSSLSLERIAINLNDATIPDNAGVQPVDAPVVEGGPAAYFSTLPIKAMLHSLADAGIPAEVSQTAGTYVCNHVFYMLMHALKKQRRWRNFPDARGGFVHVPYLPGQGQPSMPLDDMVRGLRVAVACALLTRQDELAGSGRSEPASELSGT
jgi:pyroglutamyl-peptidase